jgi:hypothetical protein
LILGIISSDRDYPESCREAAASALKCFLRKIFHDQIVVIEQKDTILNYSTDVFVKLARVLHLRTYWFSLKENFHIAKPIEDSEEIRLLLVESVLSVITYWTSYTSEIVQSIRASSDHDDIIARVNEIYETLPSLLLDPFPELKRISCQLLIGLSQIFPLYTIRHMQALLLAVIGNSPERISSDNEIHLKIDPRQCILYHRHSKTRLLALQVLSKILHCYSTSLDGLNIENTASMFQFLSSHVFPNVESSAPFDKNVSVRIELSNFVCELIDSILSKTDEDAVCMVELKLNPIELECIPRLIILTLLCLTDESEIVRNTASMGLESRGHILNPLLRQYSEQVLMLLITNIRLSPSLLGKVKFLRATRELVQHFNMVVNEEASCPCWTRDSVRLVLESLTECLVSKDKDIFVATQEVSFVLGRDVNSSKWAIDEITNALQSESYEGVIDIGNSRTLIVSTSKQCAVILFILSGILNGCVNNTENDFAQLLRVLSSSHVLKFIPEDKDTALSLMSVIQSLCNFEIRDDHSIIDLVICTVYIVGCGNEGNDQSGTLSLLRDISARNRSTNVLDDHFLTLLSRISNGKSEWVYGDIDLFAFDALIRFTTKSTVCTEFSEVGNIIESYLGRTIPKGLSKEEIHRAFQTKLFFMALLESIISDESSTNAQLHPYVQKMIQNALIPNLIWQPGGAMACATRKLAAAALFSLLRDDVITDVLMCKIASVIIPILNTCLGDDDPSTKELVAFSLAKIFQSVGGCLNKGDITHLHLELLQCLDDDNKSVRMASCDALNHLLQSSPRKYWEGTVIDTIVEKLLVHLDDSDSEVHERVMKALLVVTTIDSSSVLNAASKALASCPGSKCYKKIVEHVKQLHNQQLSSGHVPGLNK